mmetsp:Transcript_120047/g.346788  ORF Transcript_120047/g.346788 Transcript_120047/m.346788 type:complete len:571 (+) Transcript_120047:51-1763(+)
MSWRVTLLLVVFVGAEVAVVAKFGWMLAHCQISSWLEACRRYLCRSHAGSAPEDVGDAEIREQIIAHLADRKVRFGRNLIMGMAGFGLIRIPILFLDILTESAQIQAATSSAGAATLVFVFVSSSVLVWLPGVITQRSLPFMHFVLIVILIIMASPWGLILGPLTFSYYIVHHFVTLAVSFIDRSFGSTLLCLACIAGSFIANFVHGNLWPDGISVQDFVLAEATFFATKSALMFAIHSMMQHSAAQEVHASSSQCHRRATSSLLDVLCDAVVDLDDKLALTEHAPKLASVLMHGQGKCLQGVAFKDFVAAGWETVEAQIQRNTHGPDSSPVAGMFGGELRDAMGNRMRAVLYHVPYTTIAGAVRHLIGIQERNDDSADARLETVAMSEPARPVGVLSAEMAERLQRRHRRLCHDGASSSGSSSSGGSSAAGRSGALLVDVEVAEGLPIRGASEAFWSSFGSGSAPTHFSQTLSSQDSAHEPLLAWIRDRATKVGAGEIQAPHCDKYKCLIPLLGAQEGRHVSVLFPKPPEPYVVSLRIERASRRQRGVGRSLALGTSASAGLQPTKLGL